MQARFAVAPLLLALAISRADGQAPWPTTSWPVSTATAEGLDAKVLDRLDADISAGKFGNVDGMLIIRHGRVVADKTYPHDYGRIYGEDARKPGPLNAHEPSGPYNYFNPWWHPYYQQGDLHTMQSVTKTVTSVIIGTAIANEDFPSIDTPILTFFDTSRVANIDDRKRRLTIRHLLSMTAGLDWNEDLPYNDPRNSGSVMEASFDWVAYTIDRPMSREPGSAFQYNSGATMLLAHIFRVATGKDIEEYGQQHLFAPLGINRFFWKRTPSGLIDTEGGLYLRPQDLAKIGYLFLNNGIWDGKRIVQQEWVRSSVAPSISVGTGGVKYGLKWWLYPYGPNDSRLAWAGSGFGGQLPIVLPDYDIVMVFTGWNILPGGPRLGPGTAITRVLDAVTDKTSVQRERRPA